MTDTPTRDFSPALGEAARLAKALAHPARLAILQTLARRGTCICGEIVEVLPLAQATVSQHLKVLREAGLIQGEVDGPRSCYCLDAEAVQRAEAAFITFFSTLQPAACADDGCC